MVYVFPENRPAKNASSSKYHFHPKAQLFPLNDDYLPSIDHSSTNEFFIPAPTTRKSSEEKRTIKDVSSSKYPLYPRAKDDPYSCHLPPLNDDCLHLIDPSSTSGFVVPAPTTRKYSEEKRTTKDASSSKYPLYPTAKDDPYSCHLPPLNDDYLHLIDPSSKSGFVVPTPTSRKSSEEKRATKDALSAKYPFYPKTKDDPYSRQLPPLNDDYLPSIYPSSTSEFFIPAPTARKSSEEKRATKDDLSTKYPLYPKMKDDPYSRQLPPLNDDYLPSIHPSSTNEFFISAPITQKSSEAAKDDSSSKYPLYSKAKDDSYSHQLPPLNDNYLPLIDPSSTSRFVVPTPTTRISSEDTADLYLRTLKVRGTEKLPLRISSDEITKCSVGGRKSTDVLPEEEEITDKLRKQFVRKEREMSEEIAHLRQQLELSKEREKSKENAHLRQQLELSKEREMSKENALLRRQLELSKEREMSKEIAYLRRQLELSKERETEKQIHYSRFDYSLHQQHPLALFENKDDWRSKYGYRCYGCEDLLTGPTYECTECQFLLHKSCAEDGPPREIKSFFHPCTLFLTIKDHSYTCNACFDVGKGFTYCCKGCDFDVHVKCAQRPAMESQGDEEELIQHFTHWHPLERVHPNKHLDVGCAICDKLCSASDSSAYGCKEGCNFVVHNPCIKNMPRQVNHHPIHPSCPLILITTINSACSACDESGSRLIFRCGKCNFQLDVKCALTADMIQHFSHKHPLVLRESKEFGSEVRCRACGENCLLDPCFGCINRSCRFFLHKNCADELQPEIHHPFHFLHPLTLQGGLSYRCKACEEDGSDLVYRCEECKFQLDLKCAIFPTIESKDADKVLHGAHKHPLALYERKELGDEVRCRACTKCFVGVAPCFGCTECNFFLHKTCAVELQEKDILHPFHPHPITLSSPPPLAQGDKFQCSSCLGLDDWCLLRYRCAKCDFDLHIECAKPKLTVPDFKYEGHLHHLTYFDKTLAPVQCNICHDDAQTCFFRCLACAFNVHIYCIPLTPKTIKHQRHLHPLTVTKSPFSYELISPGYADSPDDDDDEFYCDVCEKKRHKSESVYYCAECKFIAEVSCVISELLPSLDTSDKQGTTVSIDEGDSAKEATIANLKNVIAGFRKMKKGLKKKIEEHKKSLKKLEEELKPIYFRLKELQIYHFLLEYHRRHNM